MQLHFQKTFANGEPTYFIEKIWSGFVCNEFLNKGYDGEWAIEPYKTIFPFDYDWFHIYLRSNPKILSIREDKADRWQPGKMIDFVQWIGRPYYSKTYQFAPRIPVISTQKISICLFPQIDKYPLVFVDDRLLDWKEKEQLAELDGFKSFAQFAEYHKKDFKGKIIHWTDFRF